VGTRRLLKKNEFLGKNAGSCRLPLIFLMLKITRGRPNNCPSRKKKGAHVNIVTNYGGRGVELCWREPANKEESQEIKSLGGLHVIGTERHDARRIDNQLRGRSGRQGDPGTTQFFVSLEDDLMRIFGGDRIKGLMTALNIPDDEPIQAKMVSGAIESAQSKIEGFNFDARKHLLEYDDVMNKQREIVYKKRKEFLLADNLKDKIVEIAQRMQTEENNLVEKLDAKEKEIGPENMRQIEKFICLKVLDILWQGHLSYMEHIKTPVTAARYAGRPFGGI
jgi:preprotein translocase subunit SecA